jgi:hypothetical protein
LSAIKESSRLGGNPKKHDIKEEWNESISRKSELSIHRLA